MATEAERIRDQIRRAFEGEAWHGDSVREILANVGAREAAARPLAAAHSIWELVLHMTAWKHVVCRRMEGVPTELTAEEDWRQVGDTSEDRWRHTLAALERAHQRLLDAVAGTSDRQLEEPVPGRPYDLYAMLHGIVQHDLYHAGQIAILAKGQTSRA